MTARQGQCTGCKHYYWLIDGVIVRHMPSKPVTTQAVLTDDLCAGSEQPPLDAAVAR
jgi:hypothetical protein